jgi:hypothetical protein
MFAPPFRQEAAITFKRKGEVAFFVKQVSNERTDLHTNPRFIGALVLKNHFLCKHFLL